MKLSAIHGLLIEKLFQLHVKTLGKNFDGKS